MIRSIRLPGVAAPGYAAMHVTSGPGHSVWAGAAMAGRTATAFRLDTGSGRVLATATLPAGTVAYDLAAVALKLGWFPAVGTGSGIGSQVRHLTLPAFALAFSWAAYMAQISRASVREQQGREHVATARGRGLPSALVFRHHVLRNAAVPIVTVSGLTVAGLIAGSIVVETTFGLGGLGPLLVQSVSAKDDNVVLAISLILVVAFVLATTLADLAHLALDPRVRDKAAS
ncbi:MAG: ABC transporter permease [Streptosporangiaceae bacterium]